MFSRELLVMCFKCSTLLSVFSSGRVRFCSISSALAPWYDVITMMVLVSMSGKRSMGSFCSENIPMMITATKMRITVTGRFTELE